MWWSTGLLKHPKFPPPPTPIFFSLITKKFHRMLEFPGDREILEVFLPTPHDEQKLQSTAWDDVSVIFMCWGIAGYNTSWCFFCCPCFGPGLPTWVGSIGCASRCCSVLVWPWLASCVPLAVLNNFPTDFLKWFCSVFQNVVFQYFCCLALLAIFSIISLVWVLQNIHIVYRGVVPFKL